MLGRVVAPLTSPHNVTTFHTNIADDHIYATCTRGVPFSTLKNPLFTRVTYMGDLPFPPFNPTFQVHIQANYNLRRELQLSKAWWRINLETNLTTSNKEIAYIEQFLNKIFRGRLYFLLDSMGFISISCINFAIPDVFNRSYVLNPYLFDQTINIRL